MKRSFIIILIVTLLIISVACKEESSRAEYGSLLLYTDSARTIEPDTAEITCSTYKAIGVHSDGIHQFEEVFSGSSVTINHLYIGMWSVFVEGYNSEGLLIAKSSRLSLTINAATTDTASFQLDYLSEGNGTLLLSVRVPSFDPSINEVVFSISNDSTINDVISIQKPDALIDDYYYFSTSHLYPAGAYRINIKMLDSQRNIVGTQIYDSAILYPNLVSEKVWTSHARVADPVITPTDSEIGLETLITISSETDGAIIYYTTDGSLPTASQWSQKYTGPFTINQTGTVKAIATKIGYADSSVISKDFVINYLRGGLSVTPPTHYSLDIEVPKEWSEGNYVVSGVCATIKANLLPENGNATYSWFIDGQPALFNNGDSVVNTTNLKLGTYAVHNINLYQGLHSIRVECSFGSLLLSEELIVLISDDGSIGSTGPNIEVGDQTIAGGFVFYDKGEYSDGWRYLEAAPADLRIVNGTPTIDSSLNGYSTEYPHFPFGCGSYSITDTAIGTGWSNTQSLVASMGENASLSYYANSDTTADYAARLCDILVFTKNNVTYDDWFLPSRDELNLMYTNLKEEGLGGFVNSYYWSSSASSSTAAWIQNFSNGEQISNFGRPDNENVRPIRSF